MGQSLGFQFVVGLVHGNVVGYVGLAPQQICPLANLHFGAALVGCRLPSGGHYSSHRRRPRHHTVREGANLSCTWSSGSVSIDTAAWSAQMSDTWSTISPVLQKPAP